MISNHLLFKENSKKNISIIVISFIIFFLSLVLPTIISYTNYINEKNSTIDYPFTFDQRYGDVINNLQIVALSILIVFAIIIGIFSFSYLHNRKQVDFYHSLPIKRRTLFFHNYILGIISVISTYLINVLIFILVCFSFGINESLDIAFTLKGTIWNIVFYLVFYSIFVLSTILTGNKIISLLLGVFFTNLQVIFSGLISILGGLISISNGSSFFNQAYIIKSFLGAPLIASSLYYNKDMLTNGYALYEFSITKILILYFIFAIILTFVCYKLFLTRKSEKSTVCIAFEWLKSPLKYLGVIIGSIYIGFFFKIITDYQTIWLIFGNILGAILLHCITEIIYEFDFKAVFKNWKGIIWCGIMALAISLITTSNTLYTFLEKFENLPKLENVVAVDISYPYTYYNYENALKEKENIANVMKLYELYLNKYKNNNNSEETEKQDNKYDKNSYFGINIGYKLKNGKIKYFNIMLKETEEVFSILEDILYNEETILKRNTLFSEEVDIKETEYIEIFNNAKKGTQITNPEHIKTFIEILKKDTLENAGKEKGELLYTTYINSEQNIYSNYSETLKFLEEKTNISPEEPSIEQISSIMPQFQSFYKIEDKEIIKYLLKNSKALSEYEENLKPYKLRIYYNNRNSDYRYIPVENINNVKNYLEEKGIE